MPTMPPTHRSRPGTLAPSAPSVYERQASRRIDKRFYQSPEWRELRARVLREQPLCAECMRRDGRVVAARHVHHIRERKARPDLALDRSNLEALCPPCHNGMRTVDR